MTDHGSMPFTMTMIILLVIVAVFAMKYGSQYLRDRAETDRKTDADARMAALDEKNRDLEKRLAHVEAILREVD